MDGEPDGHARRRLLEYVRDRWKHLGHEGWVSLAALQQKLGYDAERQLDIMTTDPQRFELDALPVVCSDWSHCHGNPGFTIP